jgi:hypothetical protein
MERAEVSGSREDGFVWISTKEREANVFKK